MPMLQRYESISLVVRIVTAAQALLIGAALLVSFAALYEAAAAQDCALDEARPYLMFAPLWLAFPLLASLGVFWYALRESKLFLHRGYFLFWCLAVMLGGYAHVAVLALLASAEPLALAANCASGLYASIQATLYLGILVILADIAFAFCGVVFREFVRWEAYSEFSSWPTLD